MSDLGCYRIVLEDALKRAYIQLVRRAGRLTTPMQMLVSVLQAHRYLPSEVIALELFGMHGLRMSIDYASICSYLEFYEINPIYARFARSFIRNGKVINRDSIEMLTSRKLLRSRYNLIISDNPLASPYGENYYEHFEIFPHVGDYISDGVLELSFVHSYKNCMPALSQKHLQAREQFYGMVDPSLEQAVQVYDKKLPGKKILDYIFLPRNACLGHLALVLSPNGGRACNG